MEFIRAAVKALLLFACLWLAACSDAPPALDQQPWQLLQARFCTADSALEIWETRDPEKLQLLQGAFYQGPAVRLDHLVKSPNHGLVLVVQGEAGPETWWLTLKLDQASVAFYNPKAPEQSWQAESDAMLYRALNTLLTSHMGESLDIFRRCEMSH